MILILQLNQSQKITLSLNNSLLYKLQTPKNQKFNPLTSKNPTMMIEQQNHINFKISPQKLEAEFQCTVCLNPITDCYITRCGHVYCRPCIQQTINRHHRCPFCNQELRDFKDDVFKNYHFNTIKKIVQQQIRKENNKYIGKTFLQKSKIEEDVKGEQKLMAPVQKKILELFEDTLLKYRKYLIQMYNIAKKTEQKKLIYGAKDVKTNDEVIKQLHSYILQKIPTPIISPDLISCTTQLQIVLPTKKSHKTTIKVSPLAQFSSILPYMESICSQMNVRIEGQMPNEFLINGEKTHIDERIGQLAGKYIRIQGIPIKVNVYCYTYNWDGSKLTNFYNCKTCKMKWICENCSFLCHKDHETVIQLKDHKPDWACCYCVTKCDCKAINKSSRLKV